jgi:fluoroacetyl-CoA thioesterase
MKEIFKEGDKKYFEKKVSETDLATFPSGEVHPFYSTFALTRDAEWSSRLFVLEIKEDDEEGIGTFVEIYHHSPALKGELVLFEATLEKLEKNEVICAIMATAGDRIIAKGRTGQKVIKRDKVEKIKMRINGQEKI